MDLVHFVSEKVSPAITRIRDGSDVCEYLIEGNERAALIDTGYGIGDLKGYVESLTKKPYDVFITHGHVDHAAGAYQFPKVRMHPADVELAARHCKVEFRKEMVENHAKLVLPEEDFQPQRLGDFTVLEDGEVYDLGGVTLRWIHVPGHTHGTMVPLIEEERTIMFGDACGVGVLLALPESLPVETVGANYVELVINSIPAWLNAGLNVASGMLPALGFAILLRQMPLKKYGYFLLAGFVMAAYLGMGMLAIAMVGVVICVFIFQLKEESNKQVGMNTVQGGDFEDE